MLYHVEVVRARLGNVDIIYEFQIDRLLQSLVKIIDCFKIYEFVEVVQDELVSRDELICLVLTGALAYVFLVKARYEVDCDVVLDHVKVGTKKAQFSHVVYCVKAIDL